MLYPRVGGGGRGARDEVGSLNIRAHPTRRSLVNFVHKLWPRDREVRVKLKNADPMVGEYEQYNESRALSQRLGSLTPNLCFSSKSQPIL